jgi:carboxymethylenebutenolidase
MLSGMEWNSFRTDARTGLTAEVITFPGGNGDEIHAWFARPTGDAPAPGVVVAHHLPGWDEFYREFCERLARHGYSVLCPDLYCRFGHGTPDDVAAAARAQGGAHDDVVVADLAAALSWLKALPASNGKAGIIGTCSGGRHALLTASRVADFGAPPPVELTPVELTPVELAATAHPRCPARRQSAPAGPGR